MTPLDFRASTFPELDPGTLYALLQLRSAVFVVEQACAYQDMDGLDDRCLHLLGVAPDGELDAYARLLPPGLAHPEHPSIGRVITGSRVRGTGVGRRLMEVAMAEIARRWGGDRWIVLAAQDQALDFYRRLGFEVSGPGYLEDGIPHTPMIGPAAPASRGGGSG